MGVFYKLSVILFLCVVYTSAIAHDNFHQMDWIKNYTGKRGANCCGKQDCVPANIRVTHQTVDTLNLEITRNEKTFSIVGFPSKGFHLSEDAYDYFCFTVAFTDESMQYLPEKYPCAISPNEECVNCVFISVKF